MIGTDQMLMRRHTDNRTVCGQHMAGATGLLGAEGQRREGVQARKV